MAFKIQEDLIFSDQQQQVLHLLEHPECSHVTEVFYGGAAGGGKTFLGDHWQIARRLQYPGTRGLIGRSVLKNLKLTTFKTFQDVWNEYYKDNHKGITWKFDGQYNVVVFSNGSEILLKDLFRYPSDPNFDSLGSLEISDAFIDELPEITQKAFEILQSRIRYKLDVVGSPKMLATGNPSPNWVKNRYIRGKDGNLVVLKDYQKVVKATVYDNPDEAFKEIYVSQLKKLNPIDRARLLEGNWDVNTNDNPFFYSFYNMKHIVNKEYKIDPRYQLDFSFDFNFEPCTCVVGQMLPHLKEYHIIRSHYASATNHQSSLEVLCDDLKREYYHQVNVARIRVTGDAAGKQRGADTAANVNKYTKIIKYLELYSKKQIYVEKANIDHKSSRDLCNDVLSLTNIKFYAGTELLVTNINASYPDDKGSLNKCKKELGIHDVDCFRYLMKFWFAFRLNGKRFKNYQKNLK
ncbi:MAG: hypothetical protein GY756_27000 [bacterium]|nr:hypothetical protein [bacterium]